MSQDLAKLEQLHTLMKELEKRTAYSGIREQVYPYYVSSESQSGRNPDLFDSAWAGSRGGAKVDSAWQNIKGA